MSRVTTCILSCNSFEDRRIMERINDWLKEWCHLPFTRDVWEIGFEGLGGEKNIIPSLYVAGFNYFHRDEFVAFLKTLPWRYPEEVQFFARPEREEPGDDSKFIVYTIGD